MKKSIFAVLAVSVLTSTFSWAGTVERLVCKGGIGDDSKNITISISDAKINSISIEDSNYKYDFNNNQIAQNGIGQVAAHIDTLARTIEGTEETMTNINLEFSLVNSKSVGQLLVLERFTSADEKATAEQVRVLKCK